jgi:hypothetical protein
MQASDYGRRRPMATAMKIKTVSPKKADAESLVGIQLNDRQMKLYKARKSGGTNGMKEQNHSLAPPPPAKKSQYFSKKVSGGEQQQQDQQYLGQEPTETAETVANTFSEDSASNASFSSRTSSTSRSRTNNANAFYGQRLDQQERKMYDDQGNTWRDSRSEASSAASSVSAALSAASRSSRASRSSKASSSSLGSMARLRQLQQQRGSGNKSSAMSSTGSTYSSSSKSAVSVGSSRSSSKSAVSVASSSKMSSASRSVISSTSRYAPTTMKKVTSAPDPLQEDEIMNETAASAVGSTASSGSKSSRPALSVNTKSQSSFSQKLVERKKAEKIQRKPSGLGTQKETSKFLRSTMMQWAKPSSSSSSVTSIPSALKSTKSSASSTSRTSKSSRRLSFAPKKAIITTDYRSPKSMVSGGGGAISPKEMAIMRKVADRNKSRASGKTKGSSPRRAAGKMIKSTSSRMKKLLSSSSSSSSSLKEAEKDDKSAQVETVTSNQSTLYDDSGQNVNEDAISLFVDDAPDDEAASIKSNGSPQVGEVDKRRAIVMEEDVFQDNGEGDDNVIFKNQEMRKKSKRGRSSIFKKRIGNIGMGVMDDLIESGDELSSDDDDEEYDSAEDDGHDVSIHQARSVKSSTTPRKFHREELKSTTSSRNIDSILDDNKEFLQTMRKGPLKQALNTPSMRNDMDAPVPTMSESYDTETEDYRTFTNSLKAELSGTHSKLYDSFQAMFRCGERGNNDPPQPLSVYPGSLDLNTKDSISKMSKYLNTEHDLDCLISSQIVKDFDVRNYVFNYEYKKSNRDGYGSIRQTASTDSITGGDDGSQFEVTVSQHTRKNGSVVSSTNDSRYLSASKVKSTSTFKLPPSATGTGGGNKFNQIKLKSRTVSDKNNNNETVPSSWTKVRLRPVAKPKSNGRPSITTESSETAEFHRIVLRKTPTNAGASVGKKKEFDMGLQTAPSSLTDVSGTENKPIDLDMTGTAAEQPIKLTTPTPATEGLKKKSLGLSPISGTGMKPIVVKETQKGAEENPIKLAPSTGYDEGNPIQLVPSKGEESANPIVMAPSIDLDFNEGSIMVPLEKDPEAGSDVDIRVIVGKNGITKVHSIPGQESTKANVIWRLERTEVKSALLDMSTFSVKVIVSSDSNDKENKDLRFPTSAQCMKFANALHEMKNSDGLASSNESRTSTANDDASVYVEQLSDEEQKVLDEFRQRKNNPDFTKKFLDMHNENTNAPKPMSVVNGVDPSNPVSEVSAASSTPNQMKIEKKFRLMLQMKVPKEAIKGKMEQDGVDPSIIAKVLGEPTSSGSNNLSPEDEKKASIYRKMLKMMVPLEAVAHKMKKDGIDQKIISAVVAGSSGEASANANESAALPSLTIPEQAAAQKFQKMLKMSVPIEAVEHKMKKEGVDAKIIAYVLGQPSNSQISESAPIKSKKASSSSLTITEESTASIYRRMLKVNIPKEAVHQKMTMDGVTEKIISVVLGKSIKNANKTKKGGFKAGFHWNAIDDDVSIVGSVWSKTKTASEVGASTPALDIFKHVEEFQKKPDNAVKASKITGKSGQGSKEMANLINNNRSQNVAITLKAFNDFSYKELAQNIEFLDPFGKVKGDRALFMKDLLPTLTEVKLMKAYTGSIDNLNPVEKWFQQILDVKRVEEKVQVMRTIETLKMDAIVLGKSFQLLTDVCNQVMSSDRLPDLLDMVRQIGNRMNEGRGDDAAGFKLDFLPRLSQTKGSDKKTTALDLVVLIFCTRNQQEALMLSNDFPDIQEASRMQFADLSSDVRSLEGSFRKVKTEFDNLNREHDASMEGKPPQCNSKLFFESKSETALMKPSIRQSSRKFSGNDINTDITHRSPAPIESAVRVSMINAIKSRNGMAKQENTPSVGEVLTAIQKTNEEFRKSLSPRASLRISMEAKNQGKLEFSLEASIRRLEKFVGEANYVILPKLQSQREAAMEACNDLAAFFCETPSERTTSNLLNILAGFATGIDQAVKKHNEQQKILARREAAMKKKNNKPAKKSKLNLNPLKKKKKRPTPESSSKTSAENAEQAGEKKSLVLMVNEMLKVAGDKEIEDYVSGNMDAIGSSRLDKIYAEEKARKLSDKEDILTAIRRRRSVSTNLVPQQALSDLSATLSKDAADESRRKSRVVNRWSSRKDVPKSEASGSLPPRAAPKIAQSPKDTATDESSRRKRRSVANRWSSKPSQSHPNTPGSEVLSSVSENTNDDELQQKRLQSVVNRWASKSPVLETTTEDLDDESDIGTFQELLDKRKQNAFNRWASKRT